MLSVIVAALTLSPFVFSELVPTASGGLYPVVQPGMGAFVLHAIISIIVGFGWLISRLRHTSGAWREQMTYIFFASLVLWGIVPVTNFVLSLALQASFFASFSPVYAFIFSALIGYAIIKHRLFDIRLAIARTLAYLLLLVTLATMYALAVFSVIRLLFNDQQVGVLQNAVYIVIAIFLAFTFEPLRRFFRRLTNHILFQDAYETKLVLDQITSVLVRNVAVNKLARQSMTILNQALKSQHITLVIVRDGEHHNVERLMSVGHKKPNLQVLLDELEKHPKSLIVLDEIESRADHMYQTMLTSNVGVIAKLETTKELIGYLFLGYKESGNVFTTQDIGLIRIVADELAVAIQNALRFEQIERFNETLQRRVDDATKQLRQSNRKLQALDEAKDEFISMASHQLRTPLTSVKGYVSMALEGDAGELTSDQRRLLQEAYASAQRMVYMISDFLNVSRLQTGKFLLEQSSVYLPDLVKEEIDQLKPAAESRGLTINANIASDFPVLHLDENKMRQVIMNFIDNAIFYSKSGGTIAITLRQEDKKLVFTVEDQGIGVPQKEKDSVFSKFFRASNARHVRPDGTGIGLFMAKKVILAHGGSMIFETEENKGSTFGFNLPPKLENHPKHLDHKPAQD